MAMRVGSEGADDITQRREGLVDQLGLLEAFPFGPCLSQEFRTRQIHLSNGG